MALLMSPVAVVNLVQLVIGVGPPPPPPPPPLPPPFQFGFHSFHPQSAALSGVGVRVALVSR
jgi:hypothetical protein